MTSLEAAERWLALGIATIPIRAKSKAPALHSWKRYQTELPDKHKLEAWFSGRYNLAVLTGWQGLCVLDFDDAWVYSQWLAKIAPSLLLAISRTYRVQTARGWHIYLYTSDADIGNVKGKGWDVKAGGGYVLGVPSVHPSGHIYAPVGSPENILRIKSVWELVEKPQEELLPPSLPRDPFDMAMADECELSMGVIAQIKEVIRPEDILHVPRVDKPTSYLCPLHTETNPSFWIYPDSHWWCFGCSRGGDAISLLAKMEGISNRDAIAMLAERIDS